MKICGAQFQPKAGDIESNISKHLALIELAASNNLDLVFFPELSITGYEPTLADSLSMTEQDEQLSVFQKLSDCHNIIIGIGIPLRKNAKVYITLVFFRPNEKPLVYSKQILHEDEYPYFHSGEEQILIKLGTAMLAPAICYESLQEIHTKQAANQGAEVYLASVAKHSAGLSKADQYYSEVSKNLNLNIILSNSYGSCDNFMAEGSSAVWNNKGEKTVNLGKSEDGLVGINTQTQECLIFKL